MPLAVMKLESGFKCGPLGKKKIFIGPGGIDKRFRSKWAIDDTFENVRVTVAAFEGIKTREAFIRRIKRYNPLWHRDNYLRDVLAAYEAYRGLPKQFALRRLP